MTIAPKKTQLIPVPDAADAPSPDAHMPEAAISASWDSLETDAPENKFAYPFSVDNDEGAVPAAPGYEASTPLDPNLAPNKFPRESGSDTYSGIPGDGIVEG